MSDRGTVADLIKQLYRQDPGNSPNKMTDEKIRRTFKRAVLDPEHLKIEVFKVNEKIIGYSIVFIYWSNEYGGLISNIDELYILPKFRNKGNSNYFHPQIGKENFRIGRFITGSDSQ